MTPEQITLVEESVAAAKPQLTEIAREFYRRLFLADPQCQSMFTEEEAVQRAKFSAELEEIMSSIRTHELFLTRAAALGARHQKYGVRATHYREVGTALLGALKAGLRDRWTADVEEAWRVAYNLTAEAMMAGAARALPRA